MKKTLLSVLMILLLAFSVSAYDEQDVLGWYIFKGAGNESNALTDLSGNGRHLTNNGSSWSNSSGFDFDGFDDSIVGFPITQTPELSIIICADYDTLNNDRTLLGEWYQDAQIEFYDRSGAGMRLLSKDTTGANKIAETTTHPSGAVEQYIATWKRNNKARIYINGTNIGNVSTANYDLKGNANSFSLGSNFQKERFYHGKIHSFFLLNKSLNYSETQNITSSGCDFNLFYVPPVAPPSSNFTITVTNVNDFSANINGTVYHTTTGYIITDLLGNDTNAYNITLYNATYFFNKSYVDYNVTSNISTGMSAYPEVTIYDLWDNQSVNSWNLLINGDTYVSTGTKQYLPLNLTNQATIFTRLNYISQNLVLNLTPNSTLNLSAYQSKIKLVATEIYTNNVLTNINFNISDGVNWATGDENKYFYPKANSYNVTADKSSYFNKTQLITTVPYQTASETVNNLFNYNLTIFVRSIANASINNNTVVNITSGYYNASLNTSTGIINLSLLKGEYDLLVLPAGYAYNNFSLNSTGETGAFNTSYYSYHYTKNSIYFEFREEIGKSLINDTNITIELISDAFSYNYSTSNGTLYVDLLSPETYNIRYGGGNYSERTYYFTLNNNSYTNLTLYLLSNSSSGSQEVTITVFDTLQNTLQGAKVKTLKYDVASNSYLLVSVKETNFEGKVTEFMFINSEYYKFIVEYNSETVLSTSPTYILDTSITLYANLLTEGFNQMFALTGLYGVISYNNNTNTLTYTYDDEDGTASAGCFYAYKNSINGQTLVNTSCGVGSANTVYMSVDNSSGLSYEVKGYITKSGTTYYITNYQLLFDEKIPDSSDNLILIILLIVVITFIGFWKLEIAVILAGLATFLTSVIGLLNLSITYTVPILVLSIVAAFIINNKRGL